MTTLDTSNMTEQDYLSQAVTLSEALPYMQRYAGETVVIKYGGHAMGDPALAKLFAKDIVLLKQVGINPVVVHGGGPQIGRMLERLAVESDFIDGLRVTDQATVDVVEMVLSGSINKSIVADINQAGGFAVGLSGKDGHLIEAKKLHRTKKDPESNIERVLDLGFVGEPAVITPHILDSFLESDIIPVIAPIGAGPNGETFNINADTAAGAIASAIDAKRLLMLTDIAGVLDKDKNLIQEMNADEARNMIADGTINGGMIPKIETCLNAVEPNEDAPGVNAAVIMDGRVPHAVLLEIFTEHGAGTMVRSSEG
ncbi:acetylglutamate kinase [Terasakiella sp. A23]|uniref:acetylglutamate kinase n=1 Tax=Terasakiella sp. FCG-A23 TaxID=3080561 RepID=UPI002953D512|nr:acetylglutamate kinase [Terasakiella sp. A23]MDV7339761.1 acetylglutamate kinase [Terasakiella sp. A23]